MTFQDDIGMSELAAIREAELREAEQRCADTFEAYRAGSTSAPVMSDYPAGRVTTHIARSPSRRLIR